ncbi:MAG: glycosyltransferase, partial [Terriglobales bacterium]
MALAPSVHAVVVTHGDNQSLASRVADALLEQAAVRTLILVANGLAWDLGAWAAARPHGRVEVVEMERNRGSAAAYAAGITRARALGAELVWLFDHDNLPAPSALQELLAAYDRLSARFPRDSLAVAAYRPQQYPGVVAGVPARRWNRRRSSFLGFHIFDLPFLLWRRAPWRRVRVPPAPPAEVEV